MAAFNRGNFESALSRIKEAQLTYAIETKGEFNLAYYVKNNPAKSLVIMFSSIFVIFGSSVAVRYRLLRRKIKLFSKEEKLLLQLMKTIQRETFQNNHMSMEEYHVAMEQYENKLSDNIEKRIKTETILANILNVKGKKKALKSEREILIDLIKDIQKKYLIRKIIETKVYKNMLKSYSTRLAEIEEEIVFIEAQEELAKSGLGKMKRKVLKK